ncbi:tropinone reductase 2-like protein [Dinothrombium tinctorium]|uniref:Tropinone reductase 2-like protein n=1 Tax=Dinothrombium tinctorium TaxID=1965070 RepID=A0A3S3NWY5_9ACAR|nr:tropinone reductase 2-like protein [Dinothrombium tinctorium]RWS02148.1 tropinone reductase 2-like protein [Dinothrombium tinctorium]RWS03461.1 tropinone reductase 2-like protein [Dinothrombium tinctorium]
MAKFAGKVAIVTGASSGIGRGVAIHFSLLGCSLSLSGRNTDNLLKTKQQCLNNGLKENQLLMLDGELTNEQFCQRLIHETVEKFGKLDILVSMVNSAGIIGTGTVENTPLTAYDHMMNVNCRTVFHLMQLAIPHLRKTKGNIVNVSSVTGLRAFPGVVSYNMSKAAVDQLTRTAALELAADGIRVNAVNPGVIVTELQKRGGLDDEAYAKFLEHSKTTHALGRPGTVEEVAKTIAFLASDDASFITGVTLPIDGGRSQMCPR